jgi:hypothetical protein
MTSVGPRIIIFGIFVLQAAALPAQAAGPLNPPLPPPRPAGIDPPREQGKDHAEDLAKEPAGEPPKALPKEAVPAPEPQEVVTPSISSACSGFLASGQVEAKRVSAPLTGPGCGIDEPVTISAIIRPDSRKISVAASGVMRCALAKEFATWAAGDFSTILETGGQKIETIVTGSSYECRPRNRVAGAKLSEHGKGNALDIRGVKFAGGAHALVGDKASPIPEALFVSACKTFATVLGPGSDGYHEDHMHIDLAARRPGSHYCRWKMP